MVFLGCIALASLSFLCGLMIAGFMWIPVHRFPLRAIAIGPVGRIMGALQFIFGVVGFILLFSRRADFWWLIPCIAFEQVVVLIHLFRVIAAPGRGRGGEPPLGAGVPCSPRVPTGAASDRCKIPH